jgi:hypothetical protein
LCANLWFCLLLNHKFKFLYFYNYLFFISMEDFFLKNSSITEGCLELMLNENSMMSIFCFLSPEKQLKI